MYIRNFQMCDWSIKENIRVNEPSYQNEKFLLFDSGIIKSPSNILSHVDCMYVFQSIFT